VRWTNVLAYHIKLLLVKSFLWLFIEVHARRFFVDLGLIFARKALEATPLRDTPFTELSAMDKRTSLPHQITAGKKFSRLFIEVHAERFFVDFGTYLCK
jgi:hypothetical protein